MLKVVPPFGPVGRPGMPWGRTVFLTVALQKHRGGGAGGMGSRLDGSSHHDLVVV